MPREYESIRRSVMSAKMKSGVSRAKAKSDAKRIAAATFTKRHPKRAGELGHK